jgi:hypothetical protein
MERDGVCHVLDWVGAEGYPNVADLLEEGRQFGFSRRVARTTDFSRLGPGSRLMLFHPRGVIENHAEYHPANEPCPNPAMRADAHRRAAPDAPGTMCAALWWDDLAEGTEPVGDARHRLVVRKMPSLCYGGRARPDGVTPKYRPALIASLPLGRIAVVRGDGADAAMGAASAARLPVVEVNE